MFCEVTGPCKSVGPSHTIHLRVDGTAFGIGRNNFGQLCDGGRIHATKPVLASTQSPVSYVSVGGWHSLFLRTNGEAIACGKNDMGQLGDGTTMTKTLPGKMLYGNHTRSVSAGYQHSLFNKIDDSAWAVGGNECGQLGLGDYSIRDRAEVVLDKVSAVSAGESHSLWVRTDGSVYSAGCNEFGQLGDSTLLQRNSPVKVHIEDVANVIAGQHKSLFIKTDGTVWACGQVDDVLGYTSGPSWPRSIPAKIADRLEDVIASDGIARHEQAILGQAVYATDQRFVLDDPYYAQNSLPTLPGIGFTDWNYR